MIRKEKGIYINIRISIILIVIIITSVVLIKNNSNEAIIIAKSYENKNSTSTTITSRYGIDRTKDSEDEENILVSSDDLLEEYKEYSHTKEIEANDIGIAIEDVKIARDMDITERTGLSKENFKILVSGVRADTSGFFYENADLIYDLCEKYELNEIFFCGLISAESGWDIAPNHRRTHNYISLMSNRGLIYFSSVEEGLEKAASTLHNNYLSKGGCFYYGNTLSAMQTRFCPNSSTWVDLVYGRMKQML